MKPTATAIVKSSIDRYGIDSIQHSARRSKAQDDVADDAKSVVRQIEGARAFIIARGWTLDERHVYTDDGVSGALFTNRPDFQRMMRNAAAGAFEAVVLFDLDRFGRHAHHTIGGT